MIGILIFGIILLGVIGYFIFVNVSPQFGGNPTAAQKAEYQKADNYKDGKFQNPVPTNMDMGFTDMMGVMYEFLKGGPGREPKKPLPVVHIDSTSIANISDTLTRLTWFGHSAFLLEMAGKNILIDPMFGPTPSPLPVLGPQRFTEGLPLAVDKLPYIDIVIFSHDHYDHLDYESIMKLKDKVGQFYVPLGVGAHLTSWGVPSERIEELDWWQLVDHEGITFTSTPARHFSGRGLGNRFTTLWCGWTIKHGKDNIYFTGDSGYGPHFKEIGKRLGPFTFAMVECGQYNEKWKDIHMMPEESAQVAVDVNAKWMMPIHWGAFRLAFHSWQDPAERVTKKAKELGVKVTTPRIGEPLIIGDGCYPQNHWWQNI